jgi:hypothetical protein
MQLVMQQVVVEAEVLARLVVQRQITLQQAAMVLLVW